MTLRRMFQRLARARKRALGSPRAPNALCARRFALECLEDRTAPAATSILPGLAAAMDPPAPTIAWISTQSGNWNTASNWSTGAVPGVNDHVAINVPGVTVTVTITSGNVTVRSIQSEEELFLTGGTLTVTDPSVVNAQFRMTSGTTLIALGPAAEFIGNGPTQVDGASLTAEGGLIELPQLAFYDRPGTTSFSDSRFRATASGTIRLANLQNITLGATGSVGYDNDLSIEAEFGGRVEMPALLEIVETDTGDNRLRSIRITADNSGSEIQMDSLQRIVDVQSGSEGNDDFESSRLTVVNGGAITAPQLARLTGVVLTLDGTGTLPVANLTELNAGILRVTGGTTNLPNLATAEFTQFEISAAVDLSSLASADGAKFSVSDGVLVELPALLDYDVPALFSFYDTHFRATGPGSILRLPNLTHMALGGTGTAGYDNDITIESLAGGRIEMPALLEIVESATSDTRRRSIQIHADGALSTVALNALMRLEDNQAGSESDANYEYSRIESTNGGTIIAPQLSRLAGVLLEVGTAGSIPTAALTQADVCLFRLTDGVVDLSNLASAMWTMFDISTPVDLSGLSDADGAIFLISNGVTVDVPALADYDHPATTHYVDVFFRASGANSVLRFPNLTHMSLGATGTLGYDQDITIEALAGGRVEMPSLLQLVESETSDNRIRSIVLRADGAASSIQLDSLQRIEDVYSGVDPNEISLIEASNGGAIQAPALARLEGVLIEVTSIASLTLPALAEVEWCWFVLTASTFDLTALTTATFSHFEIGVPLVLPNLSNADGSRFLVDGGATVELPALLEYDNPGTISYNDGIFRATGVNTVLRLPNLVEITLGGTGTQGYDQDIFIEALTGGRVEMPALVEIVDVITSDNRLHSIQLRADGTASTLQLDSLQRIIDTAGGAEVGQNDEFSLIEVTNGGAIAAPDLARLQGVLLEAGATDNPPTAALTDLEFCLVRVASSALDFTNLANATYSQFELATSVTLPALSNADGSRFFVDNGAVVELPALADYENPAITYYLDGNFQATGPNSILRLPNLTRMSIGETGTQGYDQDIYINALAGGRVEMPSLLEIVDSPTGDRRYRSIEVRSDGPASIVQLGSLQRLIDSQGAYVGIGFGDYESSLIAATSGGVVQIPQLHELQGTILDYSAGVAPTNITSATSSLLRASGPMSIVLTLLTNADASSFEVSGGARLELPALVDYALPSLVNYNDAFFRATGGDSELRLPSLQSLAFGSGNAGYDNDIVVEATLGGVVDMPSLLEIVEPATGQTNSRSVELRASGFSSALSLGPLQRFLDVNAGSENPNAVNASSRLEALQGGTITIDSAETQVVGVVVIVDDRSTLDVDRLDVSANSVLRGAGTITGSVVNRGQLFPGSSPGTLTIGGDYTQTSTGSIDIELGGTGTDQFDRLLIGGTASLAGALDVSFVNGFTTAKGDVFAILTFANSFETFDTITGLDSGGGPALTFAPSTFQITLANGFSVDSTIDAPDANPGDFTADDGLGRTTLRAAIMEANARTGQDAIHLPTGIYTLTLTGAGEDNSTTGDLDIRDDLILVGSGPDRTIIDAADLDRIFQIFPGITVQLTGVTLRRGDSGAGPGGAIANDGNLTFSDSKVVQSSSDDRGGGIYNASGAELEITGTVISDNTANGAGGGLYNTGVLTLTASALLDNSALLGGGLAIDSGDVITIVGSTFAGNDGQDGGGGIEITRGFVDIADSTISGNRVTGSFSGGGVRNAGVLTLLRSTITQNTAAIAGGVANLAGGAVTVRNTILAGNTASTADTDVVGTFASQGHNLIGDIGTASGFINGVGGDIAGGGLSPVVDPLLGPLQNSGGVIQTHGLLPTSPAIDAGNNAGAPESDQRGSPRLVDGDGDGARLIDIGAVEFEGFVPIGVEFRVNTTVAGRQGEPGSRGQQLAMDAGGNFVVVWQSDGQDGDDHGIYAQRFDSRGVALGREFRVHDSGAGDQTTPAIAMTPDGSFVVAWQSELGAVDGWDVYVRRFEANGTPTGPAIRVNTTATGPQTTPSVGITANGWFLVAWEGNGPGDNEGIFAQAFDANGNTVGAESLVNTETMETQSRPAIAVNATGGAVVLWVSNSTTGSQGDIRARRMDANGALVGSEIAINAVTANNQSEPAVAMSADGAFVAAWTGAAQDGNGLGVFARRFDSAGNAIDVGEFRVNSFTAGDQYHPSVAIGADRTVLVAWTSNDEDGSGQGIFGQRYSPTGQRQGGEFQINVTTPANQSWPTAAVNRDNDFVVAWAGFGVGDIEGVFSRRFLNTFLTPDSLEPNEDFLGATDLGPVGGRLLVNNLSIHESDDIDVLRFTTLAGAVAGHSVRIQFFNSLGNLDLELYDRLGQLVRSSRSTADAEEISLAGLPMGTYFARIASVGGAVNTNYVFTLTAPEATGADRFEPNNSRQAAFDLGPIVGVVELPDLSIHSAGDQDWFRFEAEGNIAGDSVVAEFLHQAGDIDLELYDENGAILRSSLSTNNREEISLASIPAGPLYIRVFVSGPVANASYRLRIRSSGDAIPPDWLDDPTDELPENNTFETAFAVQSLPAFGFLTDLSIHNAQDQDYFAFTTVVVGTNGDNIALAHEATEGVVDLQLYDSNRASLQSTSGSANRKTISLAGLQPGNYFLRVASGQGENNRYDLRLDLPAENQDQWTILVYMTASDLSSRAKNDIEELEQAVANLSGSFNIGVYIDQAQAAPFETGGGTQTAWGGSGRAFLTPDQDATTIATTFELLGEQNSGTATSLRDFLIWGINQRPAQQTALILWGHGLGVFGSNFDDHDPEPNPVPLERLNAQELAQALDGIDLDLLAYDASLMAIAEAVNSATALADVVIASEQVGEPFGFDYDLSFEVIANLDREGTSISAATLASEIVAGYKTRYGGRSTLTAFDSADYPILSGALFDFVTTVLNGATVGDWEAIDDARSSAPAFVRPAFRDLGVFLRTLAANTQASIALRQAAQNAEAALRQSIIAEATNPQTQSGLSIYFPTDSSTTEATTYFDLFEDFQLATRWFDFLQAYTSAPRSKAGSFDPDRFELPDRNDTLVLASDFFGVAGTLAVDSLTVDRLGDVDWFRFTINAVGAAGNEISLEHELVQGAASSMRLTLFEDSDVADQIGSPIDTVAGEGSFSLNGLPAGAYLARMTANGVVPRYSLTIAAPDAAATSDRAGDNRTMAKAFELVGVADLPLFSGFVLTPDAQNPGTRTYDWFTFNGPQVLDPEPTFVRILSDTSQEIRLRLVGSNGAEILSDSGIGQAEIEFTFDPGVTYFLEVSAASAQSIGYAIDFSRNAGAVNDSVSPTVVAVQLHGTGWNAGAEWYNIATGAEQSDPHPWNNVDQIRIVFSEDVSVDQQSLDLAAVVGNYAVSAFAYDSGSFTATWTLASAIVADRIDITLSDTIDDSAGNPLDGEWVDGTSLFPSGDGQPGGDFEFRFDVFPGNVNGQGGIDVLDTLLTRLRVGLAMGSPGYDDHYDVNVDARVDVVDVLLVRLRVGQSFPTG